MNGSKGGDSRTLVEIKELCYGTPKGKLLISNLSFRLAEGQIGLVTGSNGLGKSTLLRILLGAAMPISGLVELGVPRRQISYLPQMQNRAFHIPLSLSDVMDFSRPTRTSPVFEQDRRRLCLLNQEQLSRSWNLASGGERQKALLAMTLLRPSPLVLLDEPLNHMDWDGQVKLAEALSYATRVQGKTVLMVSHGRDFRPLLGENLMDIHLEQYAPQGSGNYDIVT